MGGYSQNENQNTDNSNRIGLSILPLALVSFIMISVYTEEINGVAVDDLRSITSAQIDIIDNFFLGCDMNMSILSDKVYNDKNECIGYLVQEISL